MKTFFKIVAWSGIIIVIIGSIISFSESYILTFISIRIGVDWGHTTAAFLGIIGLVMMITGGVISKPEYFWLGSIIAGSLYILSFFSLYLGFPDRIRDNQSEAILYELGMSVLPGSIMVIEGIWLKIRERKRIANPR
jgi:hypothetical protein